jgi:hypothetical protein
MITVIGATGHTGKKISEALLKASQKVRAPGRSESRLVEFKISGAEMLQHMAALPKNGSFDMSISRPFVRHMGRAWIQPVEIVGKPSFNPRNKQEGIR